MQLLYNEDLFWPTFVKKNNLMAKLFQIFN